MNSGIPSIRRRQTRFASFAGLFVLAWLALPLAAHREGPEPGQPTTSAANSTASSAAKATITEDISFAQITDPHIFDAGKKLHKQGVYEEALDNRAALHWAIIEINRLVASGKRLDFVAVTGDWGLENVQVPGDPSASEAPVKGKCPPPWNSGEGPVPALSLESAAKEFADELRGLVVEHVYFVPGNNDVCEEAVSDLHRYAEFVFEVQQEIPGRVVDLTHMGEALVVFKDAHLVNFLNDKVKAGNGKATNSREWKEAEAAKVMLASKTATTGADYERGFQLVGLNSASFKSAANFSAAPPGAPGTPAYEIQRMKRIVTDGGSYLVFTHIPDLNDPVALKAKSGGAPDPKKIVKEVVNRAKGTAPSAWQVEPTLLGDWNKLASKSELVGIFAGHFHSSNRALYGVASEDHPLAVRRDVAAKTWVAPPLAVKYQFPKPEKLGAADNPVTQTARGILVANVSSTGATTVSIYWYGTLDPKSVSDADIALAEADAEALDEHWDKAATKYADAMKSTDSRVRATATAGYLRARGKMRKWWWLLSPVRWVWIHRTFVLWIVGIALALLLLARPTGHGLFSWIGWIVKKVFMPPFTGHATIQTPAALTKDAPVDLFAAELSKGARQVTEVLEWFGVNTFGGSVTLLSMPSEVTTKMAEDFPAVVKGVDLTKIFEFLLAMTRYFTWRVESKMGFCPDPPTGAGTASGPGGEIHAFATLRWAWFCVGDWGLKRRATSQYEVNPAAFSLAARILWKAIRNDD